MAVDPWLIPVVIWAGVFAVINWVTSLRCQTGTTRNITTSLVHSIVSSGFFLAVESIALGRLAVSHGTDADYFPLELAQLARECTMGYFVYDTLDLLVRLRAFRTGSDWIMIGHHSGILIVLGFCLYANIFHELNVLMLVAEPNSIFLHLHALMNRSAWEGSTAHLLVLRCFWFTWYVCRYFVMLTVIPAVILYGLYQGKYAADLLQVVIVVLALLAILLIGVGHLSVHRSMSKAHQRALGRHREAKQQ
jgi:hypothetical protein